MRAPRRKPTAGCGCRGVGAAAGLRTGGGGGLGGLGGEEELVVLEVGGHRVAGAPDRAGKRGPAARRASARAGPGQAVAQRAVGAGVAVDDAAGPRSGLALGLHG